MEETENKNVLEEEEGKSGQVEKIIPISSRKTTFVEELNKFQFYNEVEQISLLVMLTSGFTLFLIHFRRFFYSFI